MELLAPAGNYESLKVAATCGADAVYLGVQKYGARASADNFDLLRLPEITEFAHLRGVKVYLTVNTLLKDSELSDAVKTVIQAHKAGVDAFLVQDWGLIAELHKTAPSAVLHASTQMGITNAYGAAVAKEAGLTRIVVARESLPQDILAIKRETGLEVEVFCQGALCVAYSGNCYYSSLVSGCSGNRGKCLQLCRKKYRTDSESGYFLSAKDICLLDKVQQLKDMGVDCIKIEGRMRSPEYVAQSVTVYRQTIDAAPPENGRELLKEVFNRGDYCNAYFSDPTEKVIYSIAQNHIGRKCGTVRAVKNGKAVIATDGSLKTGDGVKYLRNGYETGGGLIDGLPETGYRGNVRIGDTVCLTSKAALKQQLAAMDARIPANAYISVTEQHGARIDLSCRDVSVTATGEESVTKAKKHALTQTAVADAIGSLGGTDFSLQSIDIQVQDDIFYPASQLKDMRKRAVSLLHEKLLKSYPFAKAQSQNQHMPEILRFSLSTPSVFVQVSDCTLLRKIEFAYDYVILNPSDYSDVGAIERACYQIGRNVLLNLPPIVRGKDADILKRLRCLPVCGVVANNICHYKLFPDIPVLDGLCMNRLNGACGGAFIDSVESDKPIGGIRYAYGKPPLMHVAHCPRKTHGETCKNCTGYAIRMTDDKGADIEFRRVKIQYCYGVLIPVLPVNIISDSKNSSMLLDFTYATEQEIRCVNEQIRTGKPYMLSATRGNMGKLLQ
ncbi:MAG: U32 family peptidase [Clostridia bacterium]|nr:U32 family peptidase [Clostridia bacterium]